MNSTGTSASTFGSLLSDLRAESATLLRQEAALAKAELTQVAGRAAKNSMAIAHGSAVAYTGLLVLLIGAGQLLAIGLVALGLGASIAAWIGTIVVGAATGLTGLVMYTKAKKGLRDGAFDLPETRASLQEDKEWLERKIETARR
ncbi:MAG TPA: phage holin family protein [Lacunisphaera sp.]|nr:phage holin family protein [Lacunisphaera sp.]